MKTHTFEDTKNLDAHTYLDYMGVDSTRQELIEQQCEGYAVAMIYLGGYPATKIAMGTLSDIDTRHPYFDSSALLEYMRDERPDELDMYNENGWIDKDDNEENEENWLGLPEEIVIQFVPMQEHWAVVENLPGCLPTGDPVRFATLGEAQLYVQDELKQEYGGNACWGIDNVIDIMRVDRKS